MNYRIFETDDFIRDIGTDFEWHQKKILKKLKYYIYPQLKENPRFGCNIKKLRNFSPDTWRYRIGNYRFFYQIDEKEKTVFMIEAEHRNKVTDRLIIADGYDSIGRLSNKLRDEIGNIWQLKAAKSRFSKLVNKTYKNGPNCCKIQEKICCCPFC